MGPLSILHLSPYPFSILPYSSCIFSLSLRYAYSMVFEFFLSFPHKVLIALAFFSHKLCFPYLASILSICCLYPHLPLAHHFFYAFHILTDLFTHFFPILCIVLSFSFLAFRHPLYLFSLPLSSELHSLILPLSFPRVFSIFNLSFYILPLFFRNFYRCTHARELASSSSQQPAS